MDDLLRGSVRLLWTESHFSPPGATPAAGLATSLSHHLTAGAEKVTDILLSPLIIQTREPVTMSPVPRPVPALLRHLAKSRTFLLSIDSNGLRHFIVFCDHAKLRCPGFFIFNR